MIAVICWVLYDKNPWTNEWNEKKNLGNYLEVYSSRNYTIYYTVTRFNIQRITYETGEIKTTLKVIIIFSICQKKTTTKKNV